MLIFFFGSVIKVNFIFKETKIQQSLDRRSPNIPGRSDYMAVICINEIDLYFKEHLVSKLMMSK